MDNDKEQVEAPKTPQDQENSEVHTKTGLLGLETLHDPNNAIVDIVFVHGMGGDMISTWMKDGICWPYDVLPKNLSHAKIMTFGWRARLGESDAGHQVRECALDLLTNLMYTRACTGASERPIIFVSHSIGGLITRQTIIESVGHSNVQDMPIFKTTIGMIFLGTPESSIQMDNAYKFATKYGRFLNAFHSSKHLETFIQKQAYEFMQCTTGISIVSFYEERPTRSVGLIVPMSAVVRPSDKAHLLTLPTDHNGLTRFAREHDEGYRRILDQIVLTLEQRNIRPMVTQPKPQRPQTKKSRKPVTEFRTLLKSVASMVEQIENGQEPSPQAGVQSLRKELGYLTHIFDAFSSSRNAWNRNVKLASTVSRMMADIATPLKQLSEGFQAGNSTDVSARNTLEHARNYEETAFAIGRALTTMNTVLLLSSEPNNYNYWRSTQPLALVGRRQNATFELDALTLSARYGGPHIVPKAEPGSVAEKTAWFMSFEQCQRFVQERRGEEFKYKRVKVAVLDTGLDPGLRNTVEDYIDFTDADWRTKQHRPVDNAGHGTFVKDLLHQVAPNARIYVGRVMRDDCRRREDDTDEGFDTEEEDTDEGFAAEEGDDVELQGDTDAIGDAIRHALDDEQWDVDIISMSFSTGRGYKPESVVRAIDLCTKRPILLFAAACNDGARGTPTIGYPASHFGNVFCIHSTDEGGDPSRFTPPPKPSTDNFSMVGEGLIAAYPPHLLDLDPSYDVQAEGMPQVSMDGTSMATPIVAGIAALVIEFWRQYEDLFEDHTFPEGEVATVETHGGMHSILKFMSSDDQKSGYSWIKPWELFKTGRSPEHVAVLMAYALSKRLK